MVTLTDAQIMALIEEPKRVLNPASRERKEGKHARRDFRVIGAASAQEFTLFTRQSLVIHSGFSAGLRWHAKSGEEIMLIRCNGPDHNHVNAIERQRLPFQCHVHQASERYLTAGRRGEGYAVPSTAFKTLNGALRELMRLANITGLLIEADEPDLFD